MCYVIAKNFNSTGSIALQINHGKKLVDLKKKILSKIGYDNIQLVTISRPSAYVEYEPYLFANSETDFENKVYIMYKKINNL